MARDSTPIPFDADRLVEEGRALRAIARSLVGADRADDLVHDTHVAALRQPADVRQPGPWLTGVVRRLAARWRRDETRRVAREQRVARDALDAAADPARIAAETETLQSIARAVHELAEPFRTVVVLHYWHDQPLHEIARQLDVAAATVRTRLFRGLERLRERLDARPGGRAAWIGALGAFVPREPAAAAAAATTAPLAGLTAILMNTKLLVGAAAGVVLAAAITWPSLRPADRVDPAPESTPSPVVARAAATAPAAMPAREPADGNGPAVPRAAAARQWSWPATPATTLPWTLRVRVLDDDERPVDGATVRVWVARESEALGVKVFEFAKQGAEIEVLRTDALGRATATIASGGVIAGAERAGAASMERLVQAANASDELVLTVAAPFVLRGRVLRADGAGAAGAMVTAITQGVDTRTMGIAPTPAPVRADDGGGFTLALVREAQFQVQAELGGARTFAEHVATRDGEAHDVVLTFPGAIGVRGIVVDAAGAPVVNANVRLWRHSEHDGYAYGDETRYLRCDERGAFTADLRAPDRYGLLARADGQPPSEVAWIEPSAARPFVDVQLVLPRFATIGGVVVHDDGSPLANAVVHASAGPVEMAATTAPDRRERFTTGGQVHTDEAGAFALRVHPGTDWTIVVTPDAAVRSHTLRREHVAPETRGLRIVATPAELRGCTIRGTVRSATREAPPPCTLHLAWLDEDVVARGVQEQTAAWDGAAFVLPPLPIARTIALDVVPPRDGPLAPQRIGPLTTTADGLRLDVLLQPYAEVDVRVVAPPDRTTGPLRVQLLPERSAGFSSPGSVPVGADGVAHLTRRLAGNNSLLVFGKQPGRELLRQPVTLLPGANAEIVVALPAK